MQVVARRKIRKKYALPGDSMKFSKAPGDKRSPSTTCNRKDCKQERLSNTLLPKEHSNYERPTACHQRCLDCCRSQAGVESLSHETWPKEQRKTEHPGPVQWGQSYTLKCFACASITAHWCNRRPITTPTSIVQYTAGEETWPLSVCKNKKAVTKSKFI